jgi:Ca2+-binding EF-hand superfamily protein
LRLDDVAIQRRKAFLDLFRKYDLDSNGTISSAEFVGLYEHLKEAEVVSHNRTSTFEDIDFNSGEI